jgi:hypothetical protein
LFLCIGNQPQSGTEDAFEEYFSLPSLRPSGTNYAASLKVSQTFSLLFGVLVSFPLDQKLCSFIVGIRFFLVAMVFFAKTVFKCTIQLIIFLNSSYLSAPCISPPKTKDASGARDCNVTDAGRYYILFL